jgi:hypothetical protein
MLPTLLVPRQMRTFDGIRNLFGAPGSEASLKSFKRSAGPFNASRAVFGAAARTIGSSQAKEPSFKPGE